MKINIEMIPYEIEKINTILNFFSPEKKTSVL